MKTLDSTPVPFRQGGGGQLLLVMFWESGTYF